MENLLVFDWSFIDRIGHNPFQAMLYLLLNGGWVVFLMFTVWAGTQLWLAWRYTIFGAKKQFIVLAIDVPRLHEQAPRAVENMFAYIAGMHNSISWAEKWLQGKTQDTISFEIISIEGHVRYIIRTTRPMRDIAEAAVYAQYPDAEISEVEDYTLNVPSSYPDEEWDLWGTEMIPVKPDYFPLKTYPFFEDKVSGEFKDPLSAMLESFSRIGKGEQAWFQIVLTPIAQKDFQKKADTALKKMKGEKIEAKKSILDYVVDAPLKTMDFVATQAFGSVEYAPPKKESPGQPKILGMTQTEKDILAGIENKASKIVYLSKLCFLYLAKKQFLVKSHIVHPFIGSIKQFNTNNMQSLKPETTHIGVSGTLWWFKQPRNNARKSKLVRMYRGRSNWAGTPNFHLCTEELATLWHFPHSLQVKTPQLKKTDAKRSEPPVNVPFE